MSKQKKAILILAIVAIATIGGTSAYYVSSERTHNIIATSGVGVELLEETDNVDSEGQAVPFENIINAVPGESYSKIPIVRNIDEGSAWVRIHITRTATLSDGTVVSVPNELLECNTDSLYWINDGDDYYYYKRALDAGEQTEPLFTKVTLGADLANIYNGATFNLKLSAQAVQTANNGQSIESAEGWPEE